MRLIDELGSAKTLICGHDIVKLSANRDWLVLGLGPDPQALAQSLPPEAEVSYLECPSFFDQADEEWRAAIPATWRRVDSFNPQSDQSVIMYSGAMQLFPGFWGPVGAALALPCPATSSPSEGKTALIPELGLRLITAEAAQALRDEGFRVVSIEPKDLLPLLEESRPDLYLSINFAGLDPYGASQAILARAGVPVAVWCVDNPFHCLSSLKSSFWKDVHLFVTDAWFVEPLRGLGAKSAHHLPLAANPDFFKAVPNRQDLADKLLFVGRSAFPDKNAFFSGLKLPPEAWAEALAMLGRGERPDFGWWAKQLGIERFWPGRQARLPGLGAEESGRTWRAMVLTEAARAGKLAVCGDEAWRSLVDAPFELLPPVDYYGPLAGMYASSRFVIGATSPLLPRGLTQRHFDVWAAGGCLLTDATPGLALFPQELTGPVTFCKPAEISAVIRDLETDRPRLIAQWRELIRREHTYAHRVRTILEHISP